MTVTLKVPARIIYQMDSQITALEKLIDRKQARLAELKAVRAQMEKDKPGARKAQRGTDL